MNWLLKDQSSCRPDFLPDHIERRLRFALARFGSRVERVIVFLHDRNGPRGGIDKVCRVLARVQGCGVMTAAVVDADWTAAVDRAINRVGHTVSRHLDRLREQRVGQPREALRG
jgi:ribosome-associated translation inhibitor RaiA